MDRILFIRYFEKVYLPKSNDPKLSEEYYSMKRELAVKCGIISLTLFNLYAIITKRSRRGFLIANLTSIPIGYLSFNYHLFDDTTKMLNERIDE